MAREALLIGNSVYDDAELRRLRAPAQDVAELGRVLSDPEVGSFETKTLTDKAGSEIRAEIEQFFANRRPDDFLLLYFSGHGLKDATGALYLAAEDTHIEDLANTGVTADFINACIQRSRSRRIVLILDCCYSGAFARGMVVRADQTVHVQERFGGRGLVIITASSATEYAFEDGVLTEEIDPRPSVFTRAFIEGLDTGAADLNDDAEITLDEIYDFTFDAVRLSGSRQTPCRWVFGAQGRFVLGRRRPDATFAVRSIPSPEPLVFRPPRWLTVVALVPLALGAVVGWWGIEQYAWSAMVAGAWLILLGLSMAAAALDRVELGRDGVRTFPPFPARLRWPSILAIEVRPTPTGRTIALRRADTSLSHRLVLPAPRTHFLARNVEFDDQVLTIRRWSEQWGSPAPVLTGSRWAGVRGVLAPLALILVLLVAVDRPWTWVVYTEAEQVPHACGVLDQRAADEVVKELSLAPSLKNEGNETTGQRSQCRWNISALFSIFTHGSVELKYDRFSRTSGASGSQLAARQLAEFRGQDSDAGLTLRKTLSQLGSDAYLAGSDNAIIIRSQRANVVVTVAFVTRDTSLLLLPKQERLEKIAIRGVTAITLLSSQPH
ncbi:caspase family protein [Streptosporangium sp. 'caverna']|uniref:caspase family protein n=1 Tax=Streptosporangium sp. 'caverna' TaxID=2202249 RepID=UPI000D7DD0C6|nr:caspase family protein [Streptosporangium sp. 'caverna']AWS46165.1 hypothetical protein DKM19_37595 [Streptosporangium sp. 'caverna']